MYILQSDLLGIKGVKEGGGGGGIQRRFQASGGDYGGSAPPDLWISEIYGFQVFWAPIGVEPT